MGRVYRAVYGLCGQARQGVERRIERDLFDAIGEIEEGAVGQEGGKGARSGIGEIRRRGKEGSGGGLRQTVAQPGPVNRPER